MMRGCRISMMRGCRISMMRGWGGEQTFVLDQPGLLDCREDISHYVDLPNSMVEYAVDI